MCYNLYSYLVEKGGIVMNIAEQLETALSSPDSHGNLIVAIPKSSSIPEAEKIANQLSIPSILENNMLPHSIFGVDFSFVFGEKEKFSISEYRNEFLKKCNDLGKEITIAVI